MKGKQWQKLRPIARRKRRRRTGLGLLRYVNRAGRAISMSCRVKSRGIKPTVHKTLREKNSQVKV